jgi:hypothetical protein
MTAARRLAMLAAEVAGYFRFGSRPCENSGTFSHGPISFAFRALRPSRDEEIMEIFATRGRSENFAEF